MGKSCELSFREMTDDELSLFAWSIEEGVFYYRVSCDGRYVFLIVIPLMDQRGKFNPHVIVFHETGKSQAWFNQRKEEIHKTVNRMTLDRLNKDGGNNET